MGSMCDCEGGGRGDWVIEGWIDGVCTHWVDLIFLEFGQGWTYIPCVAPLFGRVFL